MSSPKSRILYLRRFLETQTDENHPVRMQGILDYLESEGISASRKTVTQDIEALIEVGVDVVCNAGHHYEYFIGERLFELPELKLLIDAVRASRFIPPQKSKSMIGKLTSLAGEHQAAGLQRSLYVNRLSRPAVEKAYIAVDMLHTAINDHKKITCKYFEWNAQKKKEYKHRRRDYYFSPYGMVWNNDRYYTVGWSDSHGKVITLRVDRIANPKLLNTAAVPKPKGFDMAFYAESVINMYDGPLRDVTLICTNDMMKHVIDRFGEKVKTEVLDRKHFAAYISVPASPTFFAWVFTFRGEIKIAAPEDVAGSYRDMARKASL